MKFSARARFAAAGAAVGVPLEPSTRSASRCLRSRAPAPARNSARLTSSRATLATATTPHAHAHAWSKSKSREEAVSRSMLPFPKPTHIRARARHVRSTPATHTPHGVKDGHITPWAVVSCSCLPLHTRQDPLWVRSGIFACRRQLVAPQGCITGISVHLFKPARLLGGDRLDFDRARSCPGGGL